MAALALAAGDSRNRPDLVVDAISGPPAPRPMMRWSPEPSALIVHRARSRGGCGGIGVAPRSQPWKVSLVPSGDQLGSWKSASSVDLTTSVMPVPLGLIVAIRDGAAFVPFVLYAILEPSGAQSGLSALSPQFVTR